MPRKKTGQERYYYLVCVSIKPSNSKKKNYTDIWDSVEYPFPPQSIDLIPLFHSASHIVCKKKGHEVVPSIGKRMRFLNTL